MSINPTLGGTTHRLTECVISHIDLVLTYSESFSDWNGALEKDSNDLAASESPLKSHFTRIIAFLIYNLRDKSKFYDYEGLGHMFLMNNIHSVAQKIESSQDLQEILGCNYMMELSNKVEESMTDYMKTTWSGVLEYLSEKKSKRQGNWSSLLGKSNNRDVKKKFEIFNNVIENVHQKHEEMLVKDRELRQKLHKSILEKLIPAYEGFIEKYKSQIDKFQNIKYSNEEVESKILDMFLSQELAA